MRRNWLGGLLFALGLIVQALALGAPAVARPNASSRFAYEFCWRSAQSDPRQDQGSGHRDRLHANCIFCQLASGGLTSFATAPSAAEFVSTDTYLLRLHVADVPPSPLARGRARQARAPPRFS